jgi:hypothetical protein
VNADEVIDALEDLLEQVDTFEHITFTRDDAQYRSAAIWAHQLAKARQLLVEYRLGEDL